MSYRATSCQIVPRAFRCLLGLLLPPKTNPLLGSHAWADCYSCDLHAGSKMADNSVFSRLPIDIRDSLLQQAFQQLDQRHMFGVAPRVCHLWHQLSRSVKRTSLSVFITTAEAAEQLTLWMQNHGTTLQSLELRLALWVCRISQLQPLLQSVGHADHLHSLVILAGSNLGFRGYSLPTLDISLTNLTSLVSLHVRGCDLMVGPLRDSIPTVTTLRSLSLNTIDSDTMPWAPFLQQIATSLVQLTCLELISTTNMRDEDLAQLRILPQLQQVQLPNYCVFASQLSKVGPLPISTFVILMTEGTEADVHSWLQQSAASLRELVFRLSEYLRNDFVSIPPLVPLQHSPLLRSLTLLDMQPNMTHLAALTQLTGLVLKRCGLDDAGIVRLAGLSELRALDVRGNQGIMGHGGSMEVLAKSMPHLTVLKIDDWSTAWAMARAAFGLGKVNPWPYR